MKPILVICPECQSEGDGDHIWFMAKGICPIHDVKLEDLRNYQGWP